MLFKYTPIGKKYRHHVYVWFIVNPEKRLGVFIAKPKYPLYLVATALPFLMFNLYIAFVVETGKHEIRALLLDDYEKAVNTASVMLQKMELINPDNLTEDERVGFEGFLYRTPIGYVAFLRNDKPFHLEDVIITHLESDKLEHDPNVMYPVDYAKSIMEDLLGFKGESKKEQ